MSNSSGMLSALTPSHSRIVVGNGSTLPVSHTGHTTIPTTSSPIQLRNILVSPSLIKNLISVKTLYRDNPVNVEFDNFGFSVKDRLTRRVILRCNSTGDLYPVRAPSPARSLHATALISVDVWHQRLGHPGRSSLARALSAIDPSFSNLATSTCQACQIGKNVRFPFQESKHVSYFPFQLVHCDVWTSPVPSSSGFRYYLLLLDDYSHFAWTYPLRQKSDALAAIRRVHASLAATHFNLPILTLQTDNGREFDNHTAREFFGHHGIGLRMSCPYTSAQNGRAERMLRTLNETVRALLTHASMPPSFWVEALTTATFLLNRRPCRARQSLTPFELLHCT
jgi:histone deacetylase 1/2